MKHIQRFINLDSNGLGQTKKILKESNLFIHGAISQIALMGSRGLLGGFLEDSDIDLGLILHSDFKVSEDLCRKAAKVSLSRWKGRVKLDIAIVFDKMGCGLPCYKKQEYNSKLCSHGKDCIGLFKVQKGFSGFVPDMGLEVKDIYPVLSIWEKGE